MWAGRGATPPSPLKPPTALAASSCIACMTYTYTVEPVYCGHVGTNQKCPDYQGVLIFQVSLHDNVSFGTTARCVDYAGVHIFKCPD